VVAVAVGFKLSAGAPVAGAVLVTFGPCPDVVAPVG
jgi:hypothetical protein